MYVSHPRGTDRNETRTVSFAFRRRNLPSFLGLGHRAIERPGAVNNLGVTGSPPSDYQKRLATPGDDTQRNATC